MTDHRHKKAKIIRTGKKPPCHVKTYGTAPFSIVLVHGGPGVAGEMAALADGLPPGRGILEPMQTATSVAGQITELEAAIEILGHRPVILVGFSWGAWLSLMVAARYRASVCKLILIGCGPFEEDLSARVLENRLNRLEEGDRAAFISDLLILSDPDETAKDAVLARLGTLVAKTDSLDPIQETVPEEIHYRGDIFQKVWEEASEMRRTGELLNLAAQVTCPVVAIHGDSDPHPAEGVRNPLKTILKDFQFILLKNCGHKPWIERQARGEFFRFLSQELT